MIHARPNLNGNTVEDFTEAFYALGHAEKELTAAIASVQSNIIHGRNYQHLAEPRPHRSEDYDRVERLRAMVSEIARFRLDIVEAIQPERNPT